jgi:protein tyrosine/serine phosphatase
MSVGFLKGLALLGACAVLWSGPARADERGLLMLSPAVPAFRQVTSEIDRGGRPGAQGLQDLAKMGIRTVIDLEDDVQAETAERALAGRLGLGWISEPMNASQTPNDAEVNQILSLLEDSRRYPIFIHCKFGEDRTGLIIALYRVLAQRWTPQQAWNEALQDGFHQQFTAMSSYFRAKTAGH